jgi:hypothetical protein
VEERVSGASYAGWRIGKILKPGNDCQAIAQKKSLTALRSGLQ